MAESLNQNHFWEVYSLCLKKKLDSKQLIASLSEIIPNIFALEKWLL